MSEQANYVRQDHSSHFISIDPLFEDEINPSKVVSLQVSLDLANLFASTLEANGLGKHAEILRDWIERISKRAEPEVKPSVTFTNSEESEWIED